MNILTFTYLSDIVSVLLYSLYPLYYPLLGLLFFSYLILYSSDTVAGSCCSLCSFLPYIVDACSVVSFWFSVFSS